VFGLSFGEFVVLIIVAVVVVGPRNMPGLLRQAGLFIGKLRRMAIDLRADSGIDDILHEEGLREEYEKFRRLASGTVPLDDEPHAPAPGDPYAAPTDPAAAETALPKADPNAVATGEKAPGEPEAPAASDGTEPPRKA
jgi:sec-independent protein translocase protein TatB